LALGTLVLLHVSSHPLSFPLMVSAAGKPGLLYMTVTSKKLHTGAARHLKVSAWKSRGITSIAFS
jgi:hypothetical protein